MMRRRTKEWNEGLAQQLKDADFARDFIIASLDESISLKVTLKKVIRAHDAKRFARRVKDLALRPRKTSQSVSSTR
jgi:hypothetical protein